ncbi:MAG: aldolase/citrate lyase family protein [Elusimicrobiaceae bacterium]|nr:aldolase/citrate lyase family protein [Elusimicrobiaceae bacterium]
MNSLEIKMVDALRDLREKHGVVGIKAEFEAEGTRMEEALRLKEVITRAGLELSLKIGGCEAIKDMYDARSIGTARIIAPMIESAYALKKFMQSGKLAFPVEEYENMELGINVETMQTVNNLDDILASPAAKELDFVVIGRVDLSGSMGLDRDSINSEAVFKPVYEICDKCQRAGLRVGIGGGVSADSLDFFRNLPKGSLSYYETRKVIFAVPQGLGQNAPDGILKAVGFELMWLKNKRNYYGAIYEEDAHRIVMLEDRYKNMIVSAGGKYE